MMKKKIFISILLFSVAAFAANIFYQPVTIKNALTVTGNSDHGNIRISGNSISSTNANGSIFFAPNGSGVLRTDNLSFDGNTIATLDTNGNLVLAPNGSGLVTSSNEVAFSTSLAVGQGTVANSKAVLELVSTTKSFLPPRMSTAQRDAILTPPEGSTIYNTTTQSLNYYDGATWSEVGTGSGGGGTTLRWYQPDSLAAVKQVLSNGIEVFTFSNTDDQIVFCKFTIPESYSAGSQIFLKNGKAFSSVNSGNFLFSTTSYIFKANIDGTSAPTGYASTNTQQAIDGTANEIVVVSNIDITDASGEINSVAVAAGDTILVKLIRSASTETSGVAGDVNLDFDSFELDMTP